jgi:hypothetical protein
VHGDGVDAVVDRPGVGDGVDAVQHAENVVDLDVAGGAGPGR